jgi:hypothetical protein
VHREDVDGVAVERFVDDVIFMVAAVFRAADATGGDLDRLVWYKYTTPLLDDSRRGRNIRR